MSQSTEQRRGDETLPSPDRVRVVGALPGVRSVEVTASKTEPWTPDSRQPSRQSSNPAA